MHMQNTVLEKTLLIKRLIAIRMGSQHLKLSQFRLEPKVRSQYIRYGTHSSCFFKRCKSLDHCLRRKANSAINCTKHRGTDCHSFDQTAQTWESMEQDMFIKSPRQGYVRPSRALLTRRKFSNCLFVRIGETIHHSKTNQIYSNLLTATPRGENARVFFKGREIRYWRSQNWLQLLCTELLQHQYFQIEQAWLKRFGVFKLTLLSPQCCTCSCWCDSARFSRAKKSCPCRHSAL